MRQGHRSQVNLDQIDSFISYDKLQEFQHHHYPIPRSSHLVQLELEISYLCSHLFCDSIFLQQTSEFESQSFFFGRMRIVVLSSFIALASTTTSLRVNQPTKHGYSILQCTWYARQTSWGVGTCWTGLLSLWIHPVTGIQSWVQSCLQFTH
jgi:hypothetical protein